MQAHRALRETAVSLPFLAATASTEQQDQHVRTSRRPAPPPSSTGLHELIGVSQMGPLASWSTLVLLGAAIATIVYAIELLAGDR